MQWHYCSTKGGTMENTNLWALQIAWQKNVLEVIDYKYYYFTSKEKAEEYKELYPKTHIGIANKVEVIDVYPAHFQDGMLVPDVPFDDDFPIND